MFVGGVENIIRNNYFFKIPLLDDGVVCSVCCGDRSPPHSSAVRLLVLHGLPGDSAPSIRAHPVTKGSFVSACLLRCQRNDILYSCTCITQA